MQFIFKINAGLDVLIRVFLKCDVPGGANALPKGVTPPMNWKLRGVALLCSKE